jgi:hypothetical protein
MSTIDEAVLCILGMAQQSYSNSDEDAAELIEKFVRAVRLEHGARKLSWDLESRHGDSHEYFMEWYKLHALKSRALDRLNRRYAKVEEMLK